MSFVGEEAVDTGGPSRGFWRLVMKDVCHKYCHGDERRMVFARNVPTLQVRVHVYVHYNIYMKFLYILCCNMPDVSAHFFHRGRSLA